MKNVFKKSLTKKYNLKYGQIIEYKYLGIYSSKITVIKLGNKY